MRQEDINMRFTASISELASEQGTMSDKVESHGKDIDMMKSQLSSIITEVRLIRRALYAMCAIMAANIPAAQDAIAAIKGLF